MNMRAGWLTDLTNWIGEQLGAFFGALVSLLKDLIIFLVEAVLTVVELAIGALSALVPDELAGVSICGMLASAGPTVQWAVSTFNVPEGMALISAGFVFRMVRKLSTAFQW